MRILYISQYFPPEMGAPSARVSELCKYWQEMGHQVTVLTTFPSYPDGIVYEGYKDKINKLYFKETISGNDVVRVWTYPTHLRSGFRRALSYGTSLLSFSLAAPVFKDVDIVIATSPPPFIGLAAIIRKFIKGTPFVFEVRDLWPEIIEAVGAASASSLSYRIIDRIVDLTYRKSDSIVALTESFKDFIIQTRGIEEEKVKVIENAVDTDTFKPEDSDKSVLKDLGVKSKFIISYVGTIGLTHGVDVILQAAESIKNETPDIHFILVGDGYEKNRLKESALNKRLENVSFIDKQERSKIPAILNASDVSLILSKKSEMLKKTIFAKVFEPMACGVPLIVGAEGETKRIAVDRAKAGLGFEPEEPGALIKRIMKLYKEPGLRQQLGENGREFVSTSFSRRLKANEYIAILEDIVEKKRKKKHR